MHLERGIVSEQLQRSYFHGKAVTTPGSGAARASFLYVYSVHCICIICINARPCTKCFDANRSRLRFISAVHSGLVRP